MTDPEKSAIKRVVETYLYAEEGDERKGTLFSDTKILSLNPSESKVDETPISKKSRKRKGARERIGTQKIVFIDVTDGGAVVKIDTDLSYGSTKLPKHSHYLSLLKVNGAWKIVSILMPPFRQQ